MVIVSMRSFFPQLISLKQPLVQNVQELMIHVVSGVHFLKCFKFTLAGGQMSSADVIPFRVRDVKVMLIRFLARDRIMQAAERACPSLLIVITSVRPGWFSQKRFK